MKKLLLLAVVILFTPALFAQSNSSLQLSVDYSYFRFAENTYIPNFSLNGAGASISYFFNKHIGIKADFQDYGSHSLNFSVPAESAPCSGLADCPISVASNTFTYTVGPVVHFRVKKVEPFVEVMFGGAHDSSFAKIYNACNNPGQLRQSQQATQQQRLRLDPRRRPRHPLQRTRLHPPHPG